MGWKLSHRMRVGASKLLALSAVAALGAVSLSQTAQASNAASDNAGNSPYFATNGPQSPQGWDTGMNGGTGFGAWSLSASATGGYFISSATNDNVTPFFDIYDTSTTPNINTTSATRPFSGGSLSVGQTVSFDFVLNGAAGGGHVGFSLNDSSNNSLFQFEQAGFSSVAGYVTDASGTTAGVGVAYNYQTLDTASFTLTSATTYNFDVNGSLAHSGTISDATGGIQSLSFFVSGAGGGSDVQFTDLAVSAVPAPSTLAIFAGGLGLAALAVRRRVGSKV
jgi:hypothetical protein